MKHMRSRASLEIRPHRQLEHSIQMNELKEWYRAYFLIISVHFMCQLNQKCMGLTIWKVDNPVTIRKLITYFDKH